MAKMTLDDLKKLRERKKKELGRREPENKDIQIIVGMATCGIAAGAKETYQQFIDELDQHNLTNVVVKQTGCMGLCYAEPTVEVIMPDMPHVIYGNVDREVAKQIVNEHIINKKLVDNHVYDKPAADIVEK